MGVRTNQTNINLINRDKSFSLTIIKGAPIWPVPPVPGAGLGPKFAPGFSNMPKFHHPAPFAIACLF